ncbi:MAG: hypothetical protein ABI134_22940, partial [Byssovorax sp.]
PSAQLHLVTERGFGAMHESGEVSVIHRPILPQEARSTLVRFDDAAAPNAGTTAARAWRAVGPRLIRLR